VMDRRRAFSVLFRTLLLLFVSGATLAAQEPSDIRVFLQDEAIREGQRFDIYLELPREFQPGLTVRAAPDTDRMRRYSGPQYLFTSPTLEIPQDRFIVRFNYVADVAGYTTFDGFTLTWPDRRIETGEMLIPITADGEMIPPELEWNLPPGPIFEGQTVYLSLDMHRAKEIVFPETLSIETPRDGILEEVTGLGELTEYEYSGETFNRIPLATFLYTPLRSGALPIPSAEVSFNNYQRRVPGETVPVEAISDAASIESGAVGVFELGSSDPPRSMLEGEEVVFVLSIAGEGSLGVLQLPDIEVVNATIEGRDQLADYRATERGYAGSQSRSYRIRPDSPGTMQIIVPEFTWFNPLTASAVSAPARTFTIEVQQRFDDGERDPLFSELTYVEPSGLAAYFPLRLSSSVWGIALFAAIPLYLLLYLSITRRWEQRSRFGFLIFTAISAAAIVYIASNLVPLGHLEDERSAFIENRDADSGLLINRGRALAAACPWDNHLLFHLAQLEYGRDNRARSLVLIRRAVSNEPMDPFMRRALSLLEAELSLNRQFGIARLPHEDWAVMLLFLCFFVLAAALASRQFAPRWNAGFIIFTVILAVIFSTAATMLGMYRQANNQQMSVIREGGVMLKKIPDADAENWIFLPEGTTVDTKVENAGFIQIETAYGIVAWIPEDRVYDDD
jgi:heme/copper-type cytochrome/quinol oxidase subunit 4